MPSSQEELVYTTVARISFFLTEEELETILEKYYEKISEIPCGGDSMDRVIVNMLEHMVIYKRKKAEKEQSR